MNKENSNVNLITGKFQDVCLKIAKEKINCVITNLPEEYHSTLKEISGSGILRENGFCSVFKTDDDFKETIKTRTVNNNNILIILKSQNTEIEKICGEMMDRNFTIICNQKTEKKLSKNKLNQFFDELKELSTDNICTFSNKELSLKCSISQKTVYNYLQKLKGNNSIKVEIDKFMGNVRKITILKNVTIPIVKAFSDVPIVSTIVKSGDSYGNKDRKDIPKCIVDELPQKQSTKLTDAEILQDMKDLLIDVPKEQTEGLNDICKKYGFDIGVDFFINKLRCYAGYRTFEQIKAVVENYFKENNEYSRIELTHYMNLKCIDRVDIKKIKSTQ